jgi:pilus assembly protein CpaE
VYSTRETARLLSHLENRSHNPVTSVVLNNPNAATAGKVQTPDFLTAIGRPIPHEVPFEAKALAFAENLGELPSKRSAQAFKQTIAQIASDLTGQPTVVARGFLQKLGLKK